MYETYGIYALSAGAMLVLLGYLWLLIRTWRLRWWWGLALFVFPPLAVAVMILKWKEVSAPALTLLLGLLLCGLTVAGNYVLTHQIDLGPRERVVDGGLHITLTGWDKAAADYALLAGKRNTVVLQMANPDVTDQTLENLKGFDLLQELDLNDSQITDQGLTQLAQLPRLRVLRLRGTRITDKGLRENLLDKESLEELDVRDTEVASKTMRQWKNAKSDVRRYLK